MAYATLIEAGTEVMNELADPIGFWAVTTCRSARIVAEALRRTPAPRLNDELP
jgi:hypothetical protein